MLSLPFCCLSKKSLVNDKTVKWVANHCCPSLDASSCVTAKRDPLHTRASLPGEGTSPTDVITVRLLLKSLPITLAGGHLFLTPCTLHPGPGPGGHL